MKTLIFDFDGTIADSFETLLGLFGQITGRKQLLTNQELDQLRGSSIRQIIKQLNIKPWQIAKLAWRAKTLMGPKIKDITTFPGLTLAIKQLHEQNYQLIILSTNSASNITAFLQNNDLETYFHHIYGDVSFLRKSTAIKKALKKQKLDVHTTIYIGDEQRDIEAARKAGVKVVSVGWGYNFPSALKAAHPDALVHKPEQLPKVLASL